MPRGFGAAAPEIFGRVPPAGSSLSLASHPRSPHSTAGCLGRHSNAQRAPTTHKLTCHSNTTIPPGLGGPIAPEWGAMAADPASNLGKHRPTRNCAGPFISSFPSHCVRSNRPGGARRPWSVVGRPISCDVCVDVDVGVRVNPRGQATFTRSHHLEKSQVLGTDRPLPSSPHHHHHHHHHGGLVGLLPVPGLPPAGPQAPRAAHPQGHDARDPAAAVRSRPCGRDE